MHRFRFIKCSYTSNLFLWDTQEKEGMWITYEAATNSVRFVKSSYHLHDFEEKSGEKEITLQEAIEYLGWHR